MSGGWSADGRTARTWRSCEHPYMDGDRCQDCRARRVESYIQETYVRAEPLTSPYLRLPNLPMKHQAGPARVDTYNGRRKAA